MQHSILLLPGDGVGPEVLEAARHCLDATARAHALDLRYAQAAFGGAAIDAAGDPLPADTLRAAEHSDAILMGAVGGPQWDGAAKRPEAGLLALRKALGLFANLRPVKLHAGLEARSPLRAERVAGADLMIVRELTGGLYFGEKREGADSAFDGCAYSREEIERIARLGFETARKRSGRLVSVDKANVLATSRLWRKTIDAVAADYPDVTVEHLYVDAAAMALVTHPTRFDVIVTENLFGDILSDEAAVIAGSIGLLGSASLGASGPGLFEPIHGSAPDIAGRGVANPGGAIASAAMMLRYGLGETPAADTLDRALEAALRAGAATADLGGTLSTAAFADAVIDAIDARAAA